MLRILCMFSLAVGLLAAVPSSASAQVWVPLWTASPAPDRRDGPDGASLRFADQTVRQDMRMGTSATSLRFRISNELGDAPLTIGAGSVRRKGAPGDGLPLRFGGRSDIVVPVGAALLSDPVPLAVPALGEISLLLYFPEPVAPAVRRTALRIADGRQADVEDSVRYAYRQNVVSAVLGARDSRPAVIVALGDSITEGAVAVRGSHGQWPELLGSRLEQACPGRFVVLNQGISGNKVFDHGRSHGALSRLDRDVIALPGVDQVIVFEGINDIRHSGGASPRPGRGSEDMLLAYRQIADRLAQHGIRAFAGTITPFGKSERYEPVSAATRNAINAWIRGGGTGYAGVIDFDRAVRDPAEPESLPEAMTRDGLHPNDAGLERMAASIDLAMLGCQPH